MDMQNKKCVMIIDNELPVGIIANTAAIMGITLGKHMPDAVGCDVYDKNGLPHLGIIAFPVPVLKADKEKLHEIRSRLYQPEFSDLTVVDFSDIAQGCNEYDEFMKRAAMSEEGDYTYLGIGICGPKKLVNKLAGSLPLLR
ncbi:DUF2000 domain-containing protein [Clostridium sp. AM58-1XD]|uniref:DUF2000 domain-containing protein n=1 Tax=Clostridium sp. AM58-1XD TaxID=2292307 RepID=UPI000E4C8181|nr:DUF2000 domain-containing protein [Clostridium sp. AM58-1XD]RGY98546.1 DUF2000 domain-containing protein [Clostridium sp. AM58-1XD]